MASSDEVLTLDDDLLEGAKAIAEFIYGTSGATAKVYHLISKRGIPAFRLGGIICARKSTLLNFISQQEERSKLATNR